jgi:hypothetical protein
MAAINTKLTANPNQERSVGSGMASPAIADVPPR